jgi:hypothetical protein
MSPTSQILTGAAPAVPLAARGQNGGSTMTATRGTELRGMVAKLIEEEREVKAELRRGIPMSEIVKNLRPLVDPPEVVAGPLTTNGDVVRLVKLPNGAGRIDIWEKGRGWVDAGNRITPDALMPGAGRPVSANDAARLDIPTSEIPEPYGCISRPRVPGAKLYGLIYNRRDHGVAPTAGRK